MNQDNYYVSESALQDAMAVSMRRVYNWMGLGLLLTAGVAWIMQLFPGVMAAIFGSPLIWVFFMVELGMVWGLAARIHKLNPTTALMWFFAYAAINGITMSFIFLAYDLGSVALTFAVTMVTFFTMSFIGYTTKIDLSNWGGFLMMALIGFLIASVVNVFFYSELVYWIITYVGVLLFVGLTVYDTQQIKAMTAHALQSGNEDDLRRVGVRGALRLYLDFINLFLMLLRILGRRR